MYDIDLRNVKKGYSVYLFFLLIILVFMAIILVFNVSDILEKTKLDAVAVAEEIELNSYYDDENGTMYSPTFVYKVRGITYRCESKGSSTVYPHKGTVMYSSVDPRKCKTSYDNNSSLLLWVLLIILIVGAVFIVGRLLKIVQRVRLIKKLNKSGKLVKQLPYTLQKTGVELKGVPIMAPQVEYVLNGEKLVLVGDPRFDGKDKDDDGLVDLLIDESDPKNYFIDFSINRLTGNLPTDFYKQNIDGE